MKNRTTWGARLGAGLGLWCYLAVMACVPQPPGPSDITITNTNTNSQGGSGGPGASPSPSPGVCLAVATVGVKTHGSTDERSTTIQVGQTRTLDATPKDAAGNPRPDQCNVNDGISWGLAGPCTILDGSSYTPNVKGNAAGQCFVSATVKGIVSNTYTVNVTCSTCQ